MRRSEKWLLGVCFFLSGCNGLVLEVTWSKELSYILGNTLYAVSTVVAAFMGGLALGSALIGRYGARLQRPLRTYSLLQLGVSLCGIASIPLFRSTTPLFRALYQASAPGDGFFLMARFVAVFGLMLLPVMLMGMTLPVVVGAFGRSKKSYDLEAGTLYGVNTLGAVLGTLAAPFILIPALGILRTCILAGGADLVVAAIAFALDRRVGVIEDVRRAHTKSAVDPAPPSPHGKILAGWTQRQWSVGILFGISGGVAMLYEVGWFRLLGLTIGPSVYAFAVMLAIYLVGIGAGSAMVARWAGRTRFSGLTVMASLEALLGLVGLLGLCLSNVLPGVNAGIFRWAVPLVGKSAFVLSQMGVAAILVLPPCLIMGALFPFVVRALREAGRDAAPEATVGRLYVLNTFGGIVGSLLAGFLLLPAIGVWKTLAAAGILSAGIGAALAFLAAARASRLRWGAPIGMLAGAVLLVAIAPDLNLSRFNQGPYREVYRGSERPSEADGADQLIYQREGINTAVAVFRYFGSATLYVGGKPDASTNPGDLQTQSLLGHLPVLFCREPRSVAVVGYGSGATVGAVLTHPEVRKVDVLEIEQAVIDASPYFESINHDPFRDPRARLILEDGRIHLTYTGERYDVITSEPSNPWMAGISNLFTADFYRIVSRRLTPGGVFAQWIQNYDISQESFQTILGSLHEAFPHLVVFQPIPGDFIVLASMQPIVIPWEEFSRRAEAEQVSASLMRTDISNPLQFGFFLVGPEKQTVEVAKGARTRNTDDNAWLEHRMPIEMVRSASGQETSEDVSYQLYRLGQRQRLRAILAMLPGIPVGNLALEVVRFPYLWEPNPTIPREVDDRWGEFRGLQLSGIRSELGAIARPDLVEAVDSLVKDAEVYRGNRVRATDELTVATRAGAKPPREVFERAVAMAPDLPLALLLMGGCLVSQDDPAGGEAFYQRVLAHPASGAYYDALLGLAELAWSRDQKDAALALAQQAIDRNPYLGTAYVMRSRLLLSMDKPEEAARSLEQGLKLNPHHSQMEELLRIVEG
jgi:spermidine synthase